MGRAVASRLLLRLVQVRVGELTHLLPVHSTLVKVAGGPIEIRLLRGER